MRTTINIDDDLLAKATKLTGPLDRSVIVREGLKAGQRQELFTAGSEQRVHGTHSSDPSVAQLRFAYLPIAFFK